MTGLSRRERLLRELSKESNGSFATVYRALSEVSSEEKSSSIKEDDVRNRIKSLLKSERPAFAR